MQVSKYVIMQPCEYATIWVCDNKLLPHSGPIREFQLSLKACNLASWTTNWFYNHRNTRPPSQPSTKLGNQISHSHYLIVSGVCLDNVRRLSGRCLDRVWMMSNGYLESVWRARPNIMPFAFIFSKSFYISLVHQFRPKITILRPAI